MIQSAKIEISINGIEDGKLETVIDAIHDLLQKARSSTVVGSNIAYKVTYGSFEK